MRAPTRDDRPPVAGPLGRRLPLGASAGPAGTCPSPANRRALHVRLGVAAIVLAASLAAPLVIGPTLAQTAPATDPTPAAPTTAPSAPSPEVDRLIRQLANPSWKTRERAQDRLAEIGVPAEPHLRALLGRPVDTQTRMGAERALLQMAALRKLGPTLVTVRARGAKPQDVFADLSRQANLPIAPLYDNLWQQQDWPPVTLTAVEQPFWEVVRRACAATGLRPLYQAQDGGGDRIALAKDVAGEMNSPAAHAGSFMILATGVSRRPGLPNADGDPPHATDVDLQLTFFADPKWRILTRPADTQVEAVTDARDRPLRRPDAMTMMTMRTSDTDAPVWMMRTIVHDVPTDADRLKRVRGSFQVVLLSQSDPVEFADVLAARNVARRAGRQSVQLFEVARVGESYRVRLMLTRNGLSEQDWRQDREAERIRLVDAKGRPLMRGGVDAQDTGDQVTYDLTFHPAGEGPTQTGAPAKLVVQIPLEPREVAVPFELTDLPVEK